MISNLGQNLLPFINQISTILLLILSNDSSITEETEEILIETQIAEGLIRNEDKNENILEEEKNEENNLEFNEIAMNEEEIIEDINISQKDDLNDSISVDSIIGSNFADKTEYLLRKKQSKKQAIKRIYQIYQNYENFDEITCLTKNFIVIIESKLNRIGKEVNSISSLLKILLLWSENSKYQSYFFEKKNLFEKITELYSQNYANSEIKVMELINNIFINLIGEEDNEKMTILTDFQIKFRENILIPNLNTFIDHFIKYLTKKIGKKKNNSYGALEIRILFEISKIINTCRNITQIDQILLLIVPLFKIKQFSKDFQ